MLFELYCAVYNEPKLVQAILVNRELTRMAATCLKFLVILNHLPYLQLLI